MTIWKPVLQVFRKLNKEKGNEVLPWVTKTAIKLMTSAIYAEIVSFFDEHVSAQIYLLGLLSFLR